MEGVGCWSRRDTRGERGYDGALFVGLAELVRGRGGKGMQGAGLFAGGRRRRRVWQG